MTAMEPAPMTPLTPSWTAPASCSRATVTGIAGTCQDGKCSLYGPTGFRPDQGYVNFPTMTAPWSYASTDCLPPGFHSGSYFSPAQGCPSGYLTASVGFVSRQTHAMCCPSRFSSVDPLYSRDCYQASRVAAGQAFEMVVIGVSKLTTTTVVGTSTGKKYGFMATTLSTATITWPRATNFVVFHPAVSVVEVPSWTSTPDPTSTADGFHLFGFNTAISIILSIVTGVAGLTILSCVWRRCCRRRPYVAPVVPPFTPRPSTPQSDNQGHGARDEERALPGCSSCNMSSCTSWKSSWLSRPQCCTCQDTRAEVLTKEERLGRYCSSCTTRWREDVAESLPWKLACRHGKELCHCTSMKMAGCCACQDNNTSSLPLRMRLRSYCAFCRAYWGTLNERDCPREWNLKCRHARAYAWEASGKLHNGLCCCACKDARIEVLPKAKRMATYCASCRKHWSTKPDPECPPEWKLDQCHHDNQGSRCLNPGGGAVKRCCACKDTRTTRMSKVLRIQTYCYSCESFWKTKHVQDCPEEWRVASKPEACQKHETVACAAVPGNGDCCGCRDNRKTLNGLAQRVRVYCKPCQSFWRLQLSSAFPAHWISINRDFPILLPGPGGREQKPAVSYPDEDRDSHKFIHDHGPQYGPLQFGRDEDAQVVSQPMPPPKAQESRNPTASPAQTGCSQGVVKLSASQKQRLEDRKGLQYDEPKFSVPFRFREALEAEISWETRTKMSAAVILTARVTSLW